MGHNKTQLYKNIIQVVKMGVKKQDNVKFEVVHVTVIQII